jgi:hypothetical protein
MLKIECVREIGNRSDLAKDTGFTKLSAPQTSWEKTTIRQQAFLLVILVILALLASLAERASAQVTTATPGDSFAK